MNITWSDVGGLIVLLGWFALWAGVLIIFGG